MRPLSTARHHVPFAFKVLLSGEPKAVKVSLSGTRTSFKLIGDRRSGVERLAAFLHQIDVPEAQPVIHDTLSFLNKPEHHSSFFVLDPVEVFDLTEESHTKQAQRLIDEIANIDSTSSTNLHDWKSHLGHDGSPTVKRSSASARSRR